MQLAPDALCRAARASRARSSKRPIPRRGAWHGDVRQAISLDGVEGFSYRIRDRARSDDGRLGNDDSNNAVRRIDPELGPIYSTPAVATGREAGLRCRRIGDYPKAEAKAPPWPAKRRHVAGCILRHLSNGLSAENASAVEFALVQEHLRETSVVTKRAAHAGAARVVGGPRENTVRVEIGGAFRCWERDSLSRRHGHVARAERPGHLCRARHRNEPLTHAFWCIENPALDAQRLRTRRFENSGRKRATGSSRPILPSSTRIMVATEVTALVIDASRNMSFSPRGAVPPASRTPMLRVYAGRPS